MINGHTNTKEDMFEDALQIVGGNVKDIISAFVHRF